MRNEWIYLIDGREVGPLSSEELLRRYRDGQINMQDRVRSAATSTWRTYREIAFQLSMASAGASVSDKGVH